MRTLAVRMISMGCLVLSAVAPARAQDQETAAKPFSLSILYKADVMGVASGGAARGAR